MNYIDAFRKCVKDFGNKTFTKEELKERVFGTKEWADRNESRFSSYLNKQTLGNGYHDDDVCLVKDDKNLYKGRARN